MPRESFGTEKRFLPRADLLSFEELLRVARLASGLGVRKVRLTGGEPLLRAELPKLVELLAALPNLEIALTTNGSLLRKHARDLAQAGLARVTVSLDALRDEAFRALNDTDVSVATVLDGIAAAEDAGLKPVKINAVVRRGVNEDDIVPLARQFRGSGHVLRFIEYMDVGATNDWQQQLVVPGVEILARLREAFELEAVPGAYRGEVARRYRYSDGAGEIGLITSVTAPFCGDCTRARLSAEGKLYTCLFATAGTDLRELLRAGASDEAISDVLAAVWQRREDRYSELRPLRPLRLRRIEMSYIGG
jgi:cyclic pyranopterin phosphate synthase